MRRGRPDLQTEIEVPPERVRGVTRAEAETLIELARCAMVTRQRDLDAFVWADPRDVRLVDCGAGLQFVLHRRARPSRRFLLESMYGLLTLKNGVPIGYALASGLMQYAEVAYNVFETFRGGEAALVYGRLLATVRWLFDARDIHHPPVPARATATTRGSTRARGGSTTSWGSGRGLDARRRSSRASWRASPAIPATGPRARRSRTSCAIVSTGRRRRCPAARSSRRCISTASDWRSRARCRSDSVRTASVPRRTCADEAAALLGVANWRTLSPGEREAWARWAPLVAVLPGVPEWPAADRRALADVIRAKGGRYESDYVRKFDAHARLRAAVVALSRGEVAGRDVARARCAAGSSRSTRSVGGPTRYSSRPSSGRLMRPGLSTTL